MTVRDVVVVGAGHNGLVAGCYLARAGLDVEVVERDHVVGGAVSTVERWPGVRVDRGSSLHVMVRHTGIVEELQLAEVGLRYDDVDPWAVLPDPRAPLTFFVDPDATCASLEQSVGARDADAYAAFVERWQPRVEAMLAAFARPPTAVNLSRALWPIARRAGRGVGAVARELLQPADRMLDETFTDERLKAAIAWWAAQSGPPPHEVGTSPVAASLVLMHLRPPGRPRGGSGCLSEALARRLSSYGGTLRLGDGATAIEPATGSGDDRVGAVRTASGDVIATRSVVAACHVRTTVDLLGDADLAATATRQLRTGAGLGMVLRLLTDRLPPYLDAGPHAHAGMELLVRSRAQLRTAYGDYLRGVPPIDPPLLVMTPTATDPTLAPAGRHVVTVWTQWHPRHPAGESWESIAAREADRIVATLDGWAPGTAGSVLDRWVQSPLDLERELDLRDGNVMHLDMTLDAMFSLRPLPGWSGYRGPRRGLYLCGASTHPGGGVSGASGRSAARVLLADLARERRRGLLRR